VFPGRAFVRSSSRIVGSAYHKNTNAKVARAKGAIVGDTLRALAKGRKDGWGRPLPLAVLASTLGGGRTPSFIDRGAHPRLPLTAPAAGRPDGESPALDARRMRDLGLTARGLLAAAQQERKAKPDAGRVDTVLEGDRVLLRTKELLDAAG
jgi:hypothetical protein